MSWRLEYEQSQRRFRVLEKGIRRVKVLRRLGPRRQPGVQVRSMDATLPDEVASFSLSLFPYL